jgi:pimeloyl-ACP methyl ester carboxylesterase
MWERLQERLTRPTYAPDRLGYGFSDAPPWALSLEQYAQCTLDAVQAAGVQGSFDVLGMHVGSVEAVEIAHQAPQIRRLIAVGVPLFTAEEQQRQMEKSRDRRWPCARSLARLLCLSPASV